MINLFIWIIILLITMIWTIGAVFKPKIMGGEKSWGPVNFKISILWWISVLFILFLKLSVLNLILIFPLSIFVVILTSMKAEITNSHDRNLDPYSSILKREQPKIELLIPSIVSLIPSVVIHLTLLGITYLVNFFFII